MSRLSNKLKWIYDRWAVMQHPQEDWYRVRQQIQYRIIDRIWYGKAGKMLKSTGCIFEFDPATLLAKRYSVEGLKYIFGSVTYDDLRPYKLLNTVIADIIENDKWNHDFKNNIPGQQRFAHHIDDFDYSKGEVKYIYELSRLYFMPVVAAYAIATQNAALISRLKKILVDWSAQNPFMGTIAWRSGNVVGIRSVNLIVFYLLLSLGDNDNEFRTLFGRIIRLHFMFLKAHPSKFSSTGNHRIGELAGLICIASTFRFKGAAKVLESAFAELQYHMLTMTNADGGTKEQATRYQASLIGLFSISAIFAQSKGFSLSDACNNRLRKMYDFLASFHVAPYQMFTVGDDDSSELIYPYFDNKYNQYESILNDMPVRYGLKAHFDYYHFDLRNYVFWGDEGLDLYARQPKVAFSPDGCDYYQQSGYAIYRSDAVSFMFDMGEIGLCPTMAHGHSDILAFNMYVGGKPVLVDCGSYQYNAHYKKLRDYFHGVHSHNTISVNDQSQARGSEGMFWRSCPKVRIVKADMKALEFSASHDGYVRDGKKIMHTRSVRYDSTSRNILISDTLTADEQVNATFYLHFHPSVDVKFDCNTLITDSCKISNPIFAGGRLVRANEDKPLGWYAPEYDKIAPTYTFFKVFSFNKEISFTTKIIF